ncbi:MAG: translation initiation factor IF-2 [Methanomassiliicoccales archaeon]
MPARQPIVTVLGHVDHGKTTLLDAIRGSYVAAGESGGITQGIGATEVPIERVMKLCEPIAGGRHFTVPGLLFIDTPGHHAFVSMRARGSALSDLAVVVVDIREGLMPQTTESLRLLRRWKTPFVVAANKIDLIDGWISGNFEPFATLIKRQRQETVDLLDQAIYNLAGELSSLSFSSERYDRITDFTRNVAIVPVSAKTKDGIPDLLLVLVGLAQRFLEARLETEEGPAEGTVIEVKEEKGLGTTVDAIVYRGTLHVGDKVIFASSGTSINTRIRAILKARPLKETKDPREHFVPVDSVSAAAGVKLLLQETEGVAAGFAFFVYVKDASEVAGRVIEETENQLQFDKSGIAIKSDAIGSLEALLLEARERGISVEKGEVGPVSRRDIIERVAKQSPLERALLAFNVPILPDALEAMSDTDVRVISGNVIYTLLDSYKKWEEEKLREEADKRRRELCFPCKLMILPQHVFRISKPAIVGVRVLAGRLTPGITLMNREGREIGRVRSIRSGDEVKQFAVAGEEVAVAIEGPTVGRQINEGDILLSDIPEAHARQLPQADMNADEAEVFNEILTLRRKQDPFWGR